MAAPLAGALITAGGSLVGNMLNLGESRRASRKDREYADMAWHRQNSQNLAMWNMQNAYNHPSAQMQRFKEAGLNPNLIYGQGNTASNIEAAKPQSVNQTPANFDLRAGETMSQYYTFRNMEAQTDNLREQNNVLIEDAALRAAQTSNMLANTGKTLQDTSQGKEMFKYSLEAARESIRKTRNEADVLLTRDEREAAMNASNLKEAIERIANMREQRLSNPLQRDELRQRIALLKKDNIIKQFEVDLNKLGIRAQDPIWARIVSKLLGDSSVDDIGTGIKKGYDRYMEPYHRDVKRIRSLFKF